MPISSHASPVFKELEEAVASAVADRIRLDTRAKALELKEEELRGRALELESERLRVVGKLEDIEKRLSVLEGRGGN